MRRFIAGLVTATSLFSVAAVAQTASTGKADHYIGWSIQSNESNKGMTLMTGVPPIVIDLEGDDKLPVTALIEMSGSGNHCLIKLDSVCLIKGNHLEVR